MRESVNSLTFLEKCCRTVHFLEWLLYLLSGCWKTHYPLPSCLLTPCRQFVWGSRWLFRTVEYHCPTFVLHWRLFKVLSHKKIYISCLTQWQEQLPVAPFHSWENETQGQDLVGLHAHVCQAEVEQPLFIVLVFLRVWSIHFCFHLHSGGLDKNRVTIGIWYHWGWSTLESRTCREWKREHKMEITVLFIVRNYMHGWLPHKVILKQNYVIYLCIFGAWAIPSGTK